MNAKEIRELTLPELNDKLAKLKEELFNLRFQLAINQLDNPTRINAVKKDIARVKTVIREIERMGIEILGIGINSNHLADLISHQASITTMDELAPAMFSILQQTLLRHRGA